MLNMKRKPPQLGDKPTNCSPVKRQKPTQDAATSARPPWQTSHRGQNLTLANWLYAYIDAHPGVSQANIVGHFQTRHELSHVFELIFFDSENYVVDGGLDSEPAR